MSKPAASSMKTPRSGRIAESKSRIVFVIVNSAVMCLMVLICIYPIWYVLIQSLSGTMVSGKGFIIPYQITLKNYALVFQLKGVFPALTVSVARTIVGTCVTAFCCMMLGYLFTKREMPFHTVLYRIVIITMYVSGGLIPTFLVMKAYSLTNSFWAYIVPNAVNAFYIILIKTFIEQLPASVEESAKLDGAGVMVILTRIIFPMSLPIMATIAVYSSVFQWNSWFDNHIYNASTQSLTTLQYMLYNFLMEAERLVRQIEQSVLQGAAVATLTPKGVRMTVTMITVAPVLMIYPFLQRFFVKGIMIGAVKG